MHEGIPIKKVYYFSMHHSTVKSRSGQTLGATSVQIYRRKVAQQTPTRTQKPNPLSPTSPVMILAEFQLVMSMPM